MWELGSVHNFTASITATRATAALPERITFCHAISNNNEKFEKLKTKNKKKWI